MQDFEDWATSSVDGDRFARRLFRPGRRPGATPIFVAAAMVAGVVVGFLLMQRLFDGPLRGSPVDAELPALALAVLVFAVCLVAVPVLFGTVAMLMVWSLPDALDRRMRRIVRDESRLRDEYALAVAREEEQRAAQEAHDEHERIATFLAQYDNDAP